jgi:DNA repair protein RadC
MDQPPSGCPERTKAPPEPAPPLTVRELVPDLRPREALALRGAEHLPDDALLAILLRSGRQGRNVVELARDVLQAFGGLKFLARASFEEIQARRIPGLGRVKAMEVAAALELGRRAAAQAPAEEAPVVRDPASVANLLRPLFGRLHQEVFWALLLDARNRLIGRPLEITKGLLDASLVHPREVFHLAIRHSAAAMILAHNHPSGDPTPSAEDLRVTRQLVEASRIIGIRVLDHVIIGRDTAARVGHLSLREHGLAAFDPG